MKKKTFAISSCSTNHEINLKITCGLSLLLLDPLLCWFIHDKKLELLLKP